MIRVSIRTWRYWAVSCSCLSAVQGASALTLGCAGGDSGKNKRRQNAVGQVFGGSDCGQRSGKLVFVKTGDRRISFHQARVTSLFSCGLEYPEYIRASA